MWLYSQVYITFILGKIDLVDANLKPEKINSIFSALHLPVGLKAGMIRKMCVKYSIFSWSSPFQITIDDLQLVLGPSMGGVSNDDSFIHDEDIGAPYDQSNCFNIFKHNVRGEKKGKCD